MDWLRRLLGESKELADCKARAGALQKTNAMQAFKILQSSKERAELQNQIAELQATLKVMAEPAVGECDKVRVRTREEGDRLARHVESQCGAAEGAMEPYKCPKCPRQPLTGERFWHIRHVDFTQRGLHGAQYRRPRTGRLASRLDEGLPTQLRKMAGGAQ